MPNNAKPNDLLHRYILRPNAVAKVRERVNGAVRQYRRSPLGDAHRLSPNAKVVFDVGANIGYVAYDFHRKWPDARIYCFEPTEQTFATLSRNMEDVAQVECINSAVSDTDGVAEFLVDNKMFGGGANSLLPHSSEFALYTRRPDYQAVEVPTVRLDTFCRERSIDHIDFLKLDIEGAEPMAIVGAGDLLARAAVDMILSEVRLVAGYEGGALLHQLTAQLADLDYRPFGVYDFAASSLGQGLWGDVLYLSPAFRRRLIEQHGAQACGFQD